MSTCPSMLTLILITWSRCSPIYPYTMSYPPHMQLIGYLGRPCKHSTSYEPPLPAPTPWIWPLLVTHAQTKVQDDGCRNLFSTFTTYSTFTSKHSAFHKQEPFSLPAELLYIYMYMYFLFNKHLLSPYFIQVSICYTYVRCIIYKAQFTLIIDALQPRMNKM